MSLVATSLSHMRAMRLTSLNLFYLPLAPSAIPSRFQSSRSSTCPARGHEYIDTQQHCDRATIVGSHHIRPRSSCRNVIEAGPQRILKGIYQIEQPRSPWRNSIATRRVSLRWCTEYVVQTRSLCRKLIPLRQILVGIIVYRRLWLIERVSKL